MIERNYDIAFTAALALREKQIQQNYRPIIGIHKWFARRPGTVFRSLLLAEFDRIPVATGFWRGHRMRGVIADPFMGGGTPVYEAARLGFHVVGADVNPMAYWIVRQALAPLDLAAFAQAAEAVVADVEQEVAALYHTVCAECGGPANVKYFIWVKVENCPACGKDVDLFPGYQLAKADRHPRHVIACSVCGALNEFGRPPRIQDPARCNRCRGPVHLEGPAVRGSVKCCHCNTEFTYPRDRSAPPRHRMWAIEYHCETCKHGREGRFFKAPDAQDIATFGQAVQLLARLGDDLPLPTDAIPAGDETDRLHRWGYRYYRQMFNERQLLGLGLLLRRILRVEHDEARHALLTVFSDFLRYQNMLCRYDTSALKCQDIFSVHGFPVGLIQCENNLLGVPAVGSGSYRHFLAKYRRAKEYGERPFETVHTGGRKKMVPTPGEQIRATLVSEFPNGQDGVQARILAAPATEVPLPPNTLQGVFTDPPYFDNVQYAELMDFCFAWLRLGLQCEVAAFRRTTTRTDAELTGNDTRGRDLEHFTEGLSAVFRHYAAALVPGAPFVFTYHHNDPKAYVPLVVAILDAGLDCTATLPAPAEMGASLHINGTSSSILDTVFVCRGGAPMMVDDDVRAQLNRDIAGLLRGGVRVTEGDVRCLAAGHTARVAINRLRANWDPDRPLAERMETAAICLRQVAADVDAAAIFQDAQTIARRANDPQIQLEAAL